MTKGINLKTIIIVVILLLVGVLGVLGMNTVKTYMSGASADVEPKNVVAKPEEDGRSATISWTTDKPAVGVVEYGTTAASLLLRGLEAESSSTSHKIVLTPLKPNTNYYFRIKIGDEVFDNNGIPYSFKTKAGDEKVVGAGGKVGVTLVPSKTVGAGGCNRTTDYNKDGKVNSLDFLECTKKGSSTGGVLAATPTSAPEGKCKAGVDYDKNGRVNSLDKIKCLQSQ